MTNRPVAAPSRLDPYSGGEAVVPDIAHSKHAWGLYVGTGGDVSLVTPEGDTLVFKNVPTGMTLDIRSTVVNASGTTAANMLALW